MLSTTLSLVPYFQSIPSVKLEIILYGVYCLLALYDELMTIYFNTCVEFVAYLHKYLFKKLSEIDEGSFYYGF